MSEMMDRAPAGPVLGSDADPRQPLLAHNSLFVTGWALSSTELETVKVGIGGKEYAASHELMKRGPSPGLPGVADALHSRYEVTLDVSGWDRGDHPFEVVAADRDGAVAAMAGVVDVQPFVPPTGDHEALMEAVASGGFAMWCETPDLGGQEVVREHVEVSGWAVAGTGVDRVLVTIDGRLRVQALHGLMRPDLRWCFGDDLAASCGFTLRLDPEEIPPGRHELTVIAVASDGSALGQSGAVEVVPLEVGTSAEGAVQQLQGSSTEIQEHDLPGERFLPDRDHGLVLEPEHHVRYGWVATLTAGANVLDAGCGSGWGTAVLARHARKAVGVDISPVVVAEAADRHGELAQFLEGDLLRLPFGDGEFDAVVCFEAIEHVEDVELALDELRRVLRPGGLLIASSPNRGVYPPGNPFHLNELTSSEFQALAEARFAHVAVYRQQTYVASLLGDETTLAADDPSLQLDVDVAKVVGTEPGGELYGVVLASDGELPAATERLALGTMIDHDEQRRMTEMWRERCIVAEIDAAATRTETHYARWVQRDALERLEAGQAAFSARAAELERQVAELQRQGAALERQGAELERQLAQERDRTQKAAELRAALEASLSWRITQPLRTVKRGVLGRVRDA